MKSWKPTNNGLTPAEANTEAPETLFREKTPEEKQSCW
jgi:hypothetical protein